MAKPSASVGKFVGAEGELPGKRGVRIDTPSDSRKAESKLMRQSKKASVPK